ncbi:MAG: hypothetical protein ACKPB3_04290 [Bacteroidota bacterium]
MNSGQAATVTVTVTATATVTYTASRLPPLPPAAASRRCLLPLVMPLPLEPPYSQSFTY